LNPKSDLVLVRRHGQPDERWESILIYRTFIYLLAVLALAGAGLLACWWLGLPRPVASSADLAGNAGHLVSFVATYDQNGKEIDLVYLDGEPIIFSHRTGEHPWPKTGQRIRVVGRLEQRTYYGNPQIKFLLRDARWVPDDS
jgi:hypothetical protein